MTLRRQLLLGLLGVTLLCTLLAGACMYRKLLEEANELFDYELRTLAITVPIRGTSVAAATMHGDPEEVVAIQVWDPAGRLVYASTPRPLPAAPAPGYGDIAVQGEHWRVYLARRGNDRVQAAQAISAREELAAGVALRSLSPFLIMIPVLALLMWVVVGRALSPLRRLASLVAGRSPNALQALPSEGHPPELIPVVSALNDLLRRLEHALNSQRAFVADAAHELRSPLTALKLQMQLAERAEGSAQRKAAFEKLHDRLERAIHLVQQLLVAARHESMPRNRPMGKVDLLELAQSCVADRYVAASTKGIDLGIPATAIRAVIDGHADDMRTLLGNLVDNALRYTQPGGWVDVTIDHDHDLVCLRVRDNGPGIPAHERTRVFGRFYRGGGHEEWGSGLGLAIVASIAAAHGAAVGLHDNPSGHGLCVTVSFDAASVAVRATNLNNGEPPAEPNEN
ncbi:ATP-binding protein [Massilia norwichensis]|uniref:histidine kinase n=2 Tax=Massilia TaxID=149698 RepID=A0ABT2A258_9BURK|nr:ATP-binding protein [Massilia norwichensis]MCS0588275.1 ATP-binding protein [Massilia norwichensis]